MILPGFPITFLTKISWENDILIKTKLAKKNQFMLIWCSPQKVCMIASIAWFVLNIVPKFKNSYRYCKDINVEIN